MEATKKKLFIGKVYAAAEKIHFSARIKEKLESIFYGN